VFLIMVAVIAVVVFGVAAVAAGQGGTLAGPDLDPPGPPVDPRTAEIADLAGARFPMAVRGYRMDAVDAVLDRLNTELVARDERIAELTALLVVSRRSAGG
jgi:DivIVA domain-containing protein